MATQPSGKRPSASDTPGPQLKRQRIDNIKNNGGLASLDRAVSPPPLRREPSSIALQVPAIDETNGDIFVRAYLKDRQNQGIKDVDTIDLTGEEQVLFNGSMVNAHVDHEQKQEAEGLKPESHEKKRNNGFVTGQGQTKRLASPFQLTWIRDLPDSDNVDAIRIHDILGDVMIKEAWIFNFLIDVDWVMNQFDPDIKDIVDVKIVHGSWRKQDGNRTRLEEQASRYRNAKIISAYMPEPFGTHHTKMIILFRHDELAQVIIHTSNMIEFDWTNMTQAVWRSPLLPLISIQNSSDASVPKPRPIGESFKNDLLAYLRAYGKSRVGSLYDKLGKHSFNEVKAVFVASVPGKYQLNGRGAGERWGWMGLKRVLSNIPLSNNLQDKDGDKGRIVLQVSSIATLGSMDTWLSPVLYKALSAARNITMPPSGSILAKKPKLSIIFPTAQEVRNSLNGYASGQAIHIRTQTKPQESQLKYLRPFLCHWDPSSDSSFVQSPSLTNQINSTHSGRSRAAPHIKTYIRFTDQTCRSVEWAMLTSANLSTQAWGTALKSPSGGFLGLGQGEVKISSYEVGVLIYPELFEGSNEDKVEIIPVFKKDTPDVRIENSKGAKVMGLRMPYDLPIRPYGKDDVPWCGSKSYAELDWRGKGWEI